MYTPGRSFDRFISGLGDASVWYSSTKGIVTVAVDKQHFISYANIISVLAYSRGFDVEGQTLGLQFPTNKTARWSDPHKWYKKHAPLDILRVLVLFAPDLFTPLQLEHAMELLGISECTK